MLPLLLLCGWKFLLPPLNAALALFAVRLHCSEGVGSLEMTVHQMMLHLYLSAISSTCSNISQFAQASFCRLSYLFVLAAGHPGRSLQLCRSRVLHFRANHFSLPLFLRPYSVSPSPKARKLNSKLLKLHTNVIFLFREPVITIGENSKLLLIY